MTLTLKLRHILHIHRNEYFTWTTTVVGKNYEKKLKAENRSAQYPIHKGRAIAIKRSVRLYNLIRYDMIR